jgi:hypothetical protein
MAQVREREMAEKELLLVQTVKRRAAVELLLVEPQRTSVAMVLGLEKLVKV